MYGRDMIRSGMKVRSTDGEKLGKVGDTGDRTFVIEKGLFFKDAFEARYSEIRGVDESGELVLDLAGSPGYAGATGREAGRDTEETRVRLDEERLEVDKRQREAGEVRLHKTVETEYQTVDVPVRREEVRVERTPATGASAREAGDARFEEETVRIPLREEEVEIRKRPVVREEVRVTKGAREETRQVGGEVRRERLDVSGAEENRTGYEGTDTDWRNRDR